MKNAEGNKSSDSNLEVLGFISGEEVDPKDKGNKRVKSLHRFQSAQASKKFKPTSSQSSEPSKTSSESALSFQFYSSENVERM